MDEPYYAVIFTAARTDVSADYTEMNDLLFKEVTEQDGFLGFDTAGSRIGITVSYWKDTASIQKWKSHADHIIAQERGQSEWYSSYRVRICKIESEYSFEK